MENCQSCLHWVRIEKRVYGDGSEVVTFRPNQIEHGRCEILSVESAPSFGCLSHAAGREADQIRVTQRAGAPWQHSAAGPCPDCAGEGSRGDKSCHRCAGTGKVRHYEDGYVGEERTRLHPKEIETAAAPKCSSCGHQVEAAWVACPGCGRKLDAPMATEAVSDGLAPA